MTQKLMSSLETALTDLQEMKNHGRKIIGYIPNGYMPEEIIRASGAIPLALARGGDLAPVTASSAYLARFLDPFCRAQIGYRLLKEPLYQMPDMIVVPVTDNHVRAIADSWDFYAGVEVFRFGVPHVKTGHGSEYYLEGLRLLKSRMEKLTGTPVTDKAIRKEIDISNRMRDLLREISYSRKADRPPISGKEFIELNHNSFYTDRSAFLDTLQSLGKKLQSFEPTGPEKPRILLAGSTLAVGDYKIPDLLEEAGASIVIEEFSEGIRNYRENISTEKDPMAALAEYYFDRRLPDAFFRGAVKERTEHLLNLIKEFRADGVVWYTLMYRESYDVEGYILHGILEKQGTPMLRISSDYDDSEAGSFRTRIETFASTLRERY